MHKDHKLAGNGTLTVNDLDNESFIAFERNIPTRKLLDKTFRKHSVQPKIVMTLDNIETIKRVVENGTGVSIVPENSIRDEVEHGVLKAFELENLPLEREIAIISKKGRILSNAEKKFIALLRGELNVNSIPSPAAVR